MRDDDGALMQRVRIGMIGLAGVFLLVLLAAAVFGFLGRDTMTPQGQAGSGNISGADGNQETPKEPLAELGVAPGNAPDHSAVEARKSPVRATRPAGSTGSTGR